jgi:hypothetical protein
MNTVGENLVLFITEDQISIQSLNVNGRYSILLLLPFILLIPPLYPRRSSPLYLCLLLDSIFYLFHLEIKTY